jgi:hypothetical protein
MPLKIYCSDIACRVSLEIPVPQSDLLGHCPKCGSKMRRIELADPHAAAGATLNRGNVTLLGNPSINSFGTEPFKITNHLVSIPRVLRSIKSICFLIGNILVPRFVRRSWPNVKHVLPIVAFGALGGLISGLGGLLVGTLCGVLFVCLQSR